MAKYQVKMRESYFKTSFNFNPQTWFEGEHCVDFVPIEERPRACNHKNHPEPLNVEPLQLDEKIFSCQAFKAKGTKARMLDLQTNGEYGQTVWMKPKFIPTIDWLDVSITHVSMTKFLS